MNRSTPELRPLELRNHQEGRLLEVVWSDGVTAVLPHRLLREACRCAHCLSVIRSGTAEAVSAQICLKLIEPYGPGALRLGFDDGHSRGLYLFEYLRELPAGIRKAGALQQEKELENPSSSSGLR
jgi:DUF971 family protein